MRGTRLVPLRPVLRALALRRRLQVASAFGYRDVGFFVFSYFISLFFQFADSSRVGFFFRDGDWATVFVLRG